MAKKSLAQKAKALITPKPKAPKITGTITNPLDATLAKLNAAGITARGEVVGKKMNITLIKVGKKATAQISAVLSKEPTAEECAALEKRALKELA